MNKKIKVYLQYPWKYPDSPYYKYLIKNPPNNIEYLNTKNQKGVLTNSRQLFFSHNIKRTIRSLIFLLKIPILNVRHTKSKEKFDLIHCAHCLSKNTDKPWVVDFEGDWQFFLGHENDLVRKRAKKLLINKNCKKIIVWTCAAKKRILKKFPEIKEKIDVIYPAIPLPKEKRKEHRGINLLFVGRYFFRKGGLHALGAINRLTKKYGDVKGIIVSDTPENIKKRYLKNERINFYDLMGQEKLFNEIYPICDVFVYPGYKDSFGFSMLEAMSFGIPIVTVDGFARNEIVGDDKTGFIVKENVTKQEMMKYNEKITEKIIDLTEKLIKNKKLREKMSKNCVNIIKYGKFSIKERNKKLEKVYEEALK
ncbi:glycosyltransferase family 4 protein [Candidatus Pacearchaeota archaeon]|nr:glycosyltransferase family 4 protein [Candidatus Pacearchaeota archaeon]